MIGQIIGALWMLAAVAFLVIVVLSVRKARARGQRLFVDGPTKRSEALRQVTSHEHEQDGWY